MKGQGSLWYSRQGLTHGTLNQQLSREEQGACSFRCSRHHVVETTGLTSGTAVCLLLRRNKEKERDAVEEFFMAC